MKITRSIMSYRELITKLLLIQDLDQPARVAIWSRNAENVVTRVTEAPIGHVSTVLGCGIVIEENELATCKR